MAMVYKPVLLPPNGRVILEGSPESVVRAAKRLEMYDEMVQTLRAELIELGQLRLDAGIAMSADFKREWLDAIASTAVRRSEFIRKLLDKVKGV